MNITVTVPAWLMPHHTIDAFLTRIRDGKPVADMLTYWTWDLSKSGQPYTRVGEAQITLRIQSRDDLVASQIEALKQHLDDQRAQWLTKQQEILDQITKLQALPNEVEVQS